MIDPLDTDVIEDATTGLLDHGEDPQITSPDHQVQFINNASDVIRDRVGQGEDMDDEASRFVVWLGGLDRDVMLYGLQRILKPTPIDVVFEDKAQARIDALQERLDNTNGYMAVNFETIDHHAWPKVHLDGKTLDERVKDFLDEDLRENPPEMPTADMVLNGIGWDMDMEFAMRYALATAVCYELYDYYKKIQIKKPSALDVDIFHEKMDNYLGWAVKQPLEIGTFTGRTILAIFRMQFDPKKTKYWDAYLEMYQDLILRP